MIDKFRDKAKESKGKWGIPYETKQGKKSCENRLKEKCCELCGTTESDHYEIHHVNKVKNLKGKEAWEIAMLAKRRKTLVVCRDCHRKIIHKQ